MAANARQFAFDPDANGFWVEYPDADQSIVEQVASTYDPAVPCAEEAEEEELRTTLHNTRDNLDAAIAAVDSVGGWDLLTPGQRKQSILLILRGLRALVRWALRR